MLELLHYAVYLTQLDAIVLMLTLISLFFFSGFGFVTYADPNVLERVLEAGAHVIDGKKARTHTSAFPSLP